MSLLVLARHAQALPRSYLGRRDSGGAGISPLGRRQADALGVSLRRGGIRPDLVLCGGLGRQLETAQVCLETMGVADAPVEVDPRWDEYDVERVLAGYPPERPPEDASLDPRGFQRSLDESLLSWMKDVTPPAALGTWSAFAAAAPAALDEAAKRAGSGTTVLVFTSGGPIAVVAAHLLGLSAPQALLDVHRVVVNCSVTKVISGSRGLHLLTFNEHGHFEAGEERLVTYR